MSDLVAMARAAEKDERLSDGALYGNLADEIERLKEMYRVSDAENDEMRAEIGRLRTVNKLLETALHLIAVTSASALEQSTE